ncbi:hypothetical protein [Kibdelosporangium phytohabitans]|uniref:hypothetical protein n=1 Tax=Kibdelosporangium phytohabitans TaxID=860235 RepID=UPI0019EF7111|nr:hypothetical protein [Kibdelosporangium phytohabitans]MBE1462952.1 hypothetical protein [Kibdelosporangium phytohabitans]
MDVFVPTGLSDNDNRPARLLLVPIAVEQRGGARQRELRDHAGEPSLLPRSEKQAVVRGQVKREHGVPDIVRTTKCRHAVRKSRTTIKARPSSIPTHRTRSAQKSS